MHSLYLASSVTYFAVIVLFGALHLRDDYSPIRQALSDYGVGAGQTLFLRYAMVGILASGLLAVALLVDGRFALRAGLCLLGMALLPVGVILFPTDIEGDARSARGRIHLAFAIANFALAYIAIDDLYADAEVFPALWAQHFLAGLYWVVTISLLGVAVSLVHALRHRIFGLLERLYLLTSTLWFGIFALSMGLPTPHP